MKPQPILDRRADTGAPTREDAVGGAIADDAERALLRTTTVLPGTGAPLEEVGDPDAVVEIVERYRLHEVLGSGGMGEVRLCHDTAVGRDVALKTLLAERAASAGARRRFLREARVQAQLEHPSIVPVYDVGDAPDGRPFFTMRRVRGPTLEEVLAALAGGDPTMVARWSRRRLLDAFTRVCLAVDYAHARGVLHRDLKPANVMLGDFGEVYVLDWGLAKLVADQATARPVVVAAAEPGGQREIVGTPGYMSPEQILGLGERQDARTDVYALGAILFEILTLRRLREETTLVANIRAASESRPSFGPDVPPELGARCERALAFDRGERCASARDLAEEIERYLDGDRDLDRRRTSILDGLARIASAPLPTT